jgi:hypothetical protein
MFVCRRSLLLVTKGHPCLYFVSPTRHGNRGRLATHDTCRHSAHTPPPPPRNGTLPGDNDPATARITLMPKQSPDGKWVATADEQRASSLYRAERRLTRGTSIDSWQFRFIARMSAGRRRRNHGTMAMSTLASETVGTVSPGTFAHSEVSGCHRRGRTPSRTNDGESRRSESAYQANVRSFLYHGQMSRRVQVLSSTCVMGLKINRRLARTYTGGIGRVAPRPTRTRKLVRARSLGNHQARTHPPA